MRVSAPVVLFASALLAMNCGFATPGGANKAGVAALGNTAAVHATRSPGCPAPMARWAPTDRYCESPLHCRGVGEHAGQPDPLDSAPAICKCQVGHARTRRNTTGRERYRFPALLIPMK